MILEVDDETRDFVTVYGKDFQPKRAERSKPYRPTPNYPPPLSVLSGPYKQYLNTRRYNLSVPENERSEDPQENLDKIREKYPHLQKFLPKNVPAEDLIERKENEKSVYQLDYSKDDYSPRVSVYGRKGTPIILPPDWIISETIQRKSYRNPWKIAAEKFLLVKKAGKPADNLIPNSKEREILRIGTGESEYNGTIDTTGNQIIQGCLFGKPLPVEPRIYTKGPDSSASACSEILASKKITLPSNVF